MKRKKTKKALSGSVLALVLCFVMLIGTTFAWFTSSDSTAVNKIEAGTLDVDLMMKEDGKWVSATNKTLNFTKATDGAGQDILWEPGCTYTLPTIQVVNNGNLALKYKVVVSAVLGDGNLAEVLDVLYSDTAKSVTNKNVGTLSDVLNSTDKDGFAHGNLAAKDNDGDKSGEITLSLHMQELAGNAYQNKSISGIAITVYATQDTVEWDSTRNDYDKDATLPDVDATPVASVNDLKNIKAGDSVVLTNNITTGNAADNYGDSTVGIKLAAGTTLDGNGNTLSKGDGNGYAILTAGSTIKNVTLNDSARAIFIADATADTVIDNVVIDGAGYAINTGAAGSTDVKLTVTNSTINGWTSYANIASASFTNCSFGTSTYFDGEVYQHYLRPYVASTFTNCDFDKGFYIDLTKLDKGCSVTLDNCTCNGVKLTNENFADYIKIIKGVENGSDVYAANNDTLSDVIFK